ncbi:MAG: hypothetical protein HQK73_09055 [Desulfamplus sp.]|nr:hypothetical protein [Desulfamplus sp.]MBF0412853.1 hypothetical protein [Desulfamplus sp.]
MKKLVSHLMISLGLYSVKKILITLFLLFLCCKTASIYSQNSISIYYVRFDVKSVDNRVERSNLLMVPAEDEFRQEKFTPFIISGSSDYSAAGEKGLDMQTRAIHNAIKNFLEEHGLESVKSQSTTVRGLAQDRTDFHGQTLVNDQTVVSFEGAVKLPYKILSSSFNKEIGIYSVTIQLEFAPLAFPDKWEDMRFKHKIKMLLNDFKSFF